MLGVCRKVTPYANFMKLGTVGPVGYVIALTTIGQHRLTGFGVSRHRSWVPSIDKAHRAYYIAVPTTAGTHDLRVFQQSSSSFRCFRCLTLHFALSHFCLSSLCVYATH
jgi:hypothetical protein